jgi:hypothetical protein
MVNPIVPSLERWYSIVGREKSPLWVVVVLGPAKLQVHDDDLKNIISILSESPINLVDYGGGNSNRWDCPRQPYGDMGNSTEILIDHILSPVERKISGFDGNPFKLDLMQDATRSYYGSNGGYTEYSPTLWVLPYWMLRFYKLL